MPEAQESSSLVLQERDLFRRLLELGTHDSTEPFLAEAIALIARVSSAQRAYVELFDEREGPGMESLWAATGCEPDEIPTFRMGLSHSVIAEVLASEETLLLASAVDDPRFAERGSVRRHRIQAVLCAPIIAGTNRGVIYLQGRADPGPFTDADRDRIEFVARFIAAFADRLLLRRHLHTDPTRAAREHLKSPEFIGSSDALERALRDAALAARVSATVLLTGATGTGKTMLARAIHRNSACASGPFIELNCAAIPDPLFESELFGAMPGAHSAAHRRIDGKVAAAKGGVLFLDEIGELSLGAQAKLLQLLQSKAYYPLGSTSPVKADIRIIAATNVDLAAATAERTFREDLLYRLQVLSIRMPALAERTDDIPALVHHACSRACDAYDLPRLEVSPGALASALTAEWPGNIRQLYHALESAVLRASGESAIKLEAQHLFPDQPAAREYALTYQQATRQFQRDFVKQTLDVADWNISEAARRLDISRTYLYRLISSLGVPRSATD